MTPDDFARSRIEKLLSMARDCLDKDAMLSKRYVALARRIAMRHRIKLGNRLFCKNCDTIFIVGKSFKVRTSKGRVLFVCMECGKARTAAVKCIRKKA